MNMNMKRITVVFGAGCLGGLAAAIALWLAGKYGFISYLGVKLTPVLSESWIYHRLVRGGIWGLLFLLPIARKSVVKRGLLMCIAPALVQLFVVFPYYTAEGIMGLGLGALTPLIIAVYYAVWGITAAVWLKITGE